MDGIDLKFARDYSDAVFVAVGGCGINTVSRMRKTGVTGARTLCISRFEDELSVKGDGVTSLVLLGKKATAVPVSEEERANAEKQIREFLKGTKKVLLFAGLGGFTGTAIAPIVAATAKTEGAMLGMVITYPFKMEKRRCAAAEKAYPGLQKLADDFVLMKNDDLIQMFREMPIGDAFALRDKQIAEEIGKGAQR